ncbi:MAG: undecaprenyl-phosphate glucose phosphotransferase [Bacteroidales bacterium]|jgi:putative colanic acid biosynthesis UDP-glucose lipid carrier transferase|nr:undecaprenyl-phosphate glucose phosphotransferase [Bacteroidales bacterium]
MKEVGRYKIFIFIIMLVEDVVIFNLSYLMLLPVFELTYDAMYGLMLLLVNCGYLLSVAILPFANDTRRLHFHHLVQKNFYRLSITVLILLICLFAIKLSNNVSRLFIITFFSTVLILLIIGDWITRKVLTFGIVYKHKRKAIILGSGLVGQKIYEELTGNAYLGIEVLGFFDNKPQKGCSVVGTLEDAKKFVIAHQVKMVYCTLPLPARNQIIDFLNFAERNVITFYIVPSIGYYTYASVVLQTVGNMPVFSLRRLPLSYLHNAAVKRAFDIVVSLVFLVTLFPVIFLILGIAIKWSSSGPILFVQERTGENGQIFKCYKFRSMKCNTEANTKQATADDPRTTRIGKFIRKTYLDELPQFINALKGDMSIVGPRPHMLHHTDQYSQMVNKYMVRHFVKPGITGWAQITGFRGETKEVAEMEGRIRQDIWYLENWTLLLDLEIIMKTFLLFFKDDKKAY